MAAADITPDGGKEVEDEVETSRAIFPALKRGCKGPDLRYEAIFFAGGKKMTGLRFSICVMSCKCRVTWG